MTLYHVHDGDFEIRPNEPKLMIGGHFLEKNAKTRENNKRKIQEKNFFDNW